MGKRFPGIYESADGAWIVDKVVRGVRLQGRFGSYQEAEDWLTPQIERLRRIKVHGERGRYTFEQAAAKYLLDHETKISIGDELTLLEGVMPHIGKLYLDQIHDDTLKPFVEARKEKGRKHKTINLALGVVRHILNLAARKWRDENGRTWLETPPLLTMLPLTDARPPRPITWSEQRVLLPQLPAHLARMVLFDLNTAARDDVVCSLRWEWEIFLEELGASVFLVPPEHVKGRKGWRMLVCNRVAQSIIEEVRGQHREFVFVYSRPAGKTGKGTYKPHPIETMNNTAWQNGRKDAGLQEVRVHDLRHTAAVRLREAGVREETISDILWHSRGTMTSHYSVAQVREFLAALELITDERHRTNATLQMLMREKRESLKSPLKKKAG